MVDFISDKDVSANDPFEEYYNSVIVPMVEEDNKIKEKYHSQFWGYFWSIMFLMGANLLIVLFNALMHKHPISFQQLFIVNVVAFLIMLVPIYRYRKAPKKNVFDAFVQYYGGLVHNKDTAVKLVHSPIIPFHETVSATHNVSGNCGEAKIEIRDTVYQKSGMLGKMSYQRTVSSGVVLFMTFAQNFRGKILIFDRNGFYRKKKFADMEYMNNKLDIPAANYFYIFTDNEDFAEDMLPALFFERVLDLKEVFGAKHLYIEICGNYVRMYFEGAQLYFDNYKFWSRKTDKNKFLQLNNAFEQVFMFVSLIEVLKEKQ